MFHSAAAALRCGLGTRTRSSYSRTYSPVSACRIGVGWLSEPRGASTTPPRMSPGNCSRTSATDVAGGCPCRLALVEMSGPPNRSDSARATGCAVTRTAMPQCVPTNQGGTDALHGTIQVHGPGQLELMAFNRAEGTRLQSTSSASCEASAAMTRNPWPGSRRLIANRVETARSLRGAQPRPNTASVGYASTPPPRSTSHAASS